jgi:hypothetical protein
MWVCLFSCFSYQAWDHIFSAQHYIVICGLSDSAKFSTLSHKRRNFRKQIIVHKMCEFICLKLLPDTFFILSRIQRHIVMQTRIGLHVKCQLILSFLKSSFKFTYRFSKILKYEMSWKSFQWELNCSKRTHTRTWRS